MKFLSMTIIKRRFYVESTWILCHYLKCTSKESLEISRLLIVEVGSREPVGNLCSIEGSPRVHLVYVVRKTSKEIYRLSCA